jgi:serine/threonine protein kinase
LKKRKALPLNKETWGIIYEIYKALKYLNERRIVHRDIKSANILFHKGKAKLADFGFAKQI